MRSVRPVDYAVILLILLVGVGVWAPHVSVKPQPTSTPSPTPQPWWQGEPATPAWEPGTGPGDSGPGGLPTAAQAGAAPEPPVPTPTATAKAVPTPEPGVTTDRVKMHAEPSLDSRVLRVLPGGFNLDVYGESEDGKWLLVVAPDTGEEGWVYAKYVK